MIRKISINSAYLALAHGIIKVISFFYGIFLANTLGVSGFGLYTVAITYFSLISAISDFGFNRFLVKEGSVDSLRLNKFIGVSIFLRLILISIFYLAVTLLLYFFDKNINRVALSSLAILAVMPQAVSFTFDSLLAAKQKFKTSSIGLLILSFSTTIFGIYFLSKGYDSLGAIIALLVGQIIYAIFLVIIFINEKAKIMFNFNGSDVKQMLKGSLPYGILVVLGLFYFKIDTLLISYIRGNEETGIYGVAYRFLESIIFLPSAFSAAIFPVLANLHLKDTRKIKVLYFKSLAILGSISLLVLLVFITILPYIIKQFLPNFESSVQVLYILSITIPFMFIHSVGAQVALSTDKYLKQVFLLSFITLGFNLILNLIFIPKFGYIAAAWVTVVSEIFSFALFFLLIWVKVFNHGSSLRKNI